MIVSFLYGSLIINNTGKRDSLSILSHTRLLFKNLEFLSATMHLDMKNQGLRLQSLFFLKESL